MRTLDEEDDSSDNENLFQHEESDYDVDDDKLFRQQILKHMLRTTPHDIRRTIDLIKGDKMTTEYSSRGFDDS